MVSCKFEIEFGCGVDDGELGIGARGCVVMGEVSRK